MREMRYGEEGEGRRVEGDRVHEVGEDTEQGLRERERDRKYDFTARISAGWVAGDREDADFDIAVGLTRVLLALFTR